MILYIILCQFMYNFTPQYFLEFSCTRQIAEYYYTGVSEFKHRCADYFHGLSRTETSAQARTGQRANPELDWRWKISGWQPAADRQPDGQDALHRRPRDVDNVMPLQLRHR